VKSNIGHAQAAAGVAGVIKMVQALRHGIVPKTLHANEPSSQVDWTEGAVELVRQRADWPGTDRPRRAAVSSFGISGTNAHTILEQPPAIVAGGEPLTHNGLLPLVLSAKTEPALRVQAARLRAVLRDGGPDLAGVALTLATGRSRFRHRAAVLAADRAEAVRALGALAAGAPDAAVIESAAVEGKTAFLFSGQGSQRLGMGHELHARFPVFAAAFDEAAAELDRHLDRPLTDVVWGGEAAALDQTGWTQPALFAIEVALYRLVESWGIVPQYLVGHSIGEIAAAHVAGMFTLPDACRLVAARARLMQALPAGGAMLSVRATEDEVIPLLSDRVAIAALNAPGTVVLAGDEDAVLGIADTLNARGRKTKRLPVSHAFHSPLMEPMLAEFAEVVRDIPIAEPVIPLVCNETGGLAETGRLRDPGYWVAQVRQPVRFADAVATLRDLGVGVFCEIGPDTVLSALARESLDEHPALVLPVLRADRDEMTTALTALITLHNAGATVDWQAFFTEIGAQTETSNEVGAAVRRVDLPTYAFQHERYWPPVASRPGDVTAAGLRAAGHPLLGAAVEFACGDGTLFTSRLSLRTHPWLADHAVLGRVLLPGTAFVELAVRAGQEVGCEHLGELTLGAPLVLPEHGAVQFQLRVGAPEDGGRRSVSVHSRTDTEGQPWTQHATGSLLPLADNETGDSMAGEWPPSGAEPVDTEGCYEGFAEAGFAYGEAFRCLRRVWRRDTEVFAEIELPDDVAAEGFGFHPALLDAALHASMLTGSGAGTRLPFSWEGVTLYATGARALRVRLANTADADAMTIELADTTGAPVATIRALQVRAISAEALGDSAAVQRDALFRLDWPTVQPQADLPSEIALIGEDTLGLAESLAASGIPVTTYPDLAALNAASHAAEQTRQPAVPSLVLICCAGADDLPALHERTAHALLLAQEWLGAERYSESRLVFVTRDAVGGGDLAGAAVWGLVRSAQSENPRRFRLLDLADPACLADALAIDEPQLRARDGQIHAARLARAEGEPAHDLEWDPDGTVVITGGTGGLGGILARHLAAERGVRHLLLLSRRGPAADGVTELLDDLNGHGAHAIVLPCDVTDRDALATALAAAETPIRAVLHTASVLDDGVLASLTPDRLDTVLRAKADGARHLHDLTRDRDLTAFVLFSSVAGVFGAAGQGNYAAANAYVDALAARRQAEGLPATALAWGPWEQVGGMTGTLSDAGMDRIRRSGALPLPAGRGVDLFDAALARPDALLLPVWLDLPAIRVQGEIPPLLRDLVRAPARRAAAAETRQAEELLRALAGKPAEARYEIVLDLVRAQAATVLSHPDPAGIEPGRQFRDLGFDSLTAVEFRNRLAAATGVKLPASLVFDRPSPAELAEHLLGLLGPGEADGAAAVLNELDRLQTALADLPVDDKLHRQVAGRLDVLKSRWSGRLSGETGEESEEFNYDTASDDDMFTVLDQQLQS
jgi:acyl transferase domain-containing protein/acyl carrier protein